MKNSGISYFIFLVFIVNLHGSIAYAQPYIIQSKEGFTNVRESGNAGSKVLSTIKNNSVVLLDQVEDPDLEHDEWFKILYYKEKPFSIVEVGLDEDIDMNTGYVHRSQIRELSSLKEAGKDEFRLQYVIKPFHAKNYKIEYYDGSSFAPKTINDVHYYLADCGLPKSAISSASAVINKNTIQIPNKLLWGVLSATNELVYYKNGDVYFASQTIGDGACGNHLVWVFERQKLIQRFVGWEY